MAESVRALVEGAGLSDAAIAERTGVGPTTVHDWTWQRGWRRPPEASRSTRRVERGRAGFGRRLRECLLRVRALADREAGRLAGTEPRDEAALARAFALAEAAATASARLPRRRRTPEPERADVG